MRSHVIDIQLSGNAVEMSTKDMLLDIVKKELPKEAVAMRAKLLKASRSVLHPFMKTRKRVLTLQCRGVGYAENQVFFDGDGMHPVFSFGLIEGGGIANTVAAYQFPACSKDALFRLVYRFLERNEELIPDLVIQKFVEVLEDTLAVYNFPHQLIAGQTPQGLFVIIRPMEPEGNVGTVFSLFLGRQPLEITQI